MTNETVLDSEAVTGKQLELLRSALRYIEMGAAVAGKCLDADGVAREIEHVRGVSMIGTGRDIFSMVNVDLDAIRAALGEETALSRNARKYSRG